MTDTKGGYIDKFLKKADRAVQDGVKKAEVMLDGAVKDGVKKADRAVQDGVKKAEVMLDGAVKDGVKKADGILDEAVEIGTMTAKQAARTTKELQAQAIKEKDSLQKRGIEKISRGILAAKKVTTNTRNDLDILEKLGKLRDDKIITESEFQEKKKKILERI